MKAYKIKSLIYLSCFVTAAVVYYDMEQKEKFQNLISSAPTTDIQSNELPTDEEKEEYAQVAEQ